MDTIHAQPPSASAAEAFRLKQEAAYRRLDGSFYTLIQPELVATDPVLVHASAAAASLAAAAKLPSLQPLVQAVQQVRCHACARVSAGVMLG